MNEDRDCDEQVKKPKTERDLELELARHMLGPDGESLTDEEALKLLDAFGKTLEEGNYMDDGEEE